MNPQDLALPNNFAQLPEAYSRYESSRVVILPAPLERTVSYGQGTAGGPQAIIRASQFVETYDEELESEPYLQGIATLDPCDPQDEDMVAALATIAGEARRHMAAGKFVVTLGGEHSLTSAPVRAAREVFGEIGVVQFDAHADLRDDYHDTPWSHACVMRRVVEMGVPTLAIGIRSLSTPEAQLVRERGLPVIWGHQLEEASERMARHLAGLPDKIYLTFDIDFFDPSLVPATGTPEPGGGTWYPTVALLKELFRVKTVVAMDVVELAPLENQPTSDFVAAKLIYKCLGLLQAKETGTL
jgi:agmatinase